MFRDDKKKKKNKNLSKQENFVEIYTMSGDVNVKSS